MGKSRHFTFDGGAATFFGTGIAAFLLTALTLGIGYPWAACMYHKWKCKHTYIEGRRLKFVGNGFDMLGLWIKQFALMVVTLGIYTFWVIPGITSWITEHTDYEDAAQTMQQ